MGKLGWQNSESRPGITNSCLWKRERHRTLKGQCSVKVKCGKQRNLLKAKNVLADIT